MTSVNLPMPGGRSLLQRRSSIAHCFRVKELTQERFRVFLGRWMISLLQPFKKLFAPKLDCLLSLLPFIIRQVGRFTQRTIKIMHNFRLLLADGYFSNAPQEREYIAQRKVVLEA